MCKKKKPERSCQKKPEQGSAKDNGSKKRRSMTNLAVLGAMEESRQGRSGKKGNAFCRTQKKNRQKREGGILTPKPELSLRTRKKRMQKLLRSPGVISARAVEGGLADDFQGRLFVPEGRNKRPLLHQIRTDTGKWARKAPENCPRKGENWESWRGSKRGKFRGDPSFRSRMVLGCSELSKKKTPQKEEETWDQQTSVRNFL